MTQKTNKKKNKKRRRKRRRRRRKTSGEERTSGIEQWSFYCTCSIRYILTQILYLRQAAGKKGAWDGLYFLISSLLCGIKTFTHRLHISCSWFTSFIPAPKKEHKIAAWWLTRGQEENNLHTPWSL